MTFPAGSPCSTYSKLRRLWLESRRPRAPYARNMGKSRVAVHARGHARHQLVDVSAAAEGSSRLERERRNPEARPSADFQDGPGILREIREADGLEPGRADGGELIRARQTRR